MKKYLFGLFILISFSAYSQENIPNPEIFAKSCIQQLKINPSTLSSLIITWKDAVEYLSKTQAGYIKIASLSKLEFEKLYIQENKKSLDSLLEKSKLYHINWKNITYQNTSYEITKLNTETDPPTAEIRTFFIFNNQEYSIEFICLLINNQWKIGKIMDNIYL